MKILLIILAVIVVVVVGFYILSRIVLVAMISGAGPAGDVQTEILESTPETGLRIRLELIETDSELTITTISMPRHVASDLGASPPDGFIETHLKPEGREANDPESMKFINEWNQENIQWTGQQSLTPNEVLVFVIPASSPDAGNGHIGLADEVTRCFISTVYGIFTRLSRTVFGGGGSKPLRMYAETLGPAGKQG